MSGQDYEISIDKLSILYMIKTVKHFVTNTGLCDFFIAENYMDYFNLQQFINELVESKYIYSKSVESKTLYYITSKGAETLGLLINLIPKSMIEEMDNYIVDVLHTSKNYDLLTNITSNGDGEYNVSLTAMERGESLISINLLVPSKEMAMDMCNKWAIKNQEIYEFIYKNLLE